MAKNKVLVISGDPVLLNFFQLNLREDEYQVASTQHTSERLGAVLDEELPDLVILDIMMPGLDGIEVCLRIRQWSQVPILMLSAWGAGQGYVRGLDLSADSYLTEPFGIDELRAQIKETLQRSFAAMNLPPNIRSGVS